MTPAEAQQLQDAAQAQGHWIIWLFSAELGRVVATARRADPSGGKIVGQLVADTLQELRGMLPAGLTRRDATALMRPDVIETWD